MKKNCLLCGNEFNAPMAKNNFCKRECYQRYARRHRKELKPIERFNSNTTPRRFTMLGYRTIEFVDGDE